MITKQNNWNARGTGNKNHKIKNGRSILRQCNSSEPRVEIGCIYYRSFVIA